MQLLRFVLSTPTRIRSGIQIFFTPLRMITTQRRSITGGIRAITRPFSRLGIALPKTRSDSVRLWWDSVRPQQIRRRQRISERTQFSQIHLIQLSNDKRIVLHIGTNIGRKKAEIALKQPDGRAVTLQFTLTDTGNNRFPVQLKYLPSGVRVLVNEVKAAETVALNNRDILTIGGERYLYELYAWDKAPLVTRVDAGWATTSGRVRDRNEDAIGVYQHPKGYLFAIADGVGNGQDGDLISAFAVQYLLAVFAKNIPYDLPWHDVLGTGFQYINSEVRHFAQTALLPTGSTLTAMVIKNWEAHIAHVGDTRLYRSRNGILDQLTADHVVRLPVEMPTRVAYEGNSPAPLHDLLTRAIGKVDTIQPDFLTVALQPGDRLLLVSDGITKRLSLSDLAQALPYGRASQVAEHLVELANERGTDDNASAIVVEVLSEAFIDDNWKAASKDRVFAGNRRWSLHLERREDPGTVVPLTSNGCLIVVLILIIALVVWLIFGAGARGASAMTIYPSLMSFAQPILSASR